MSKNLVLAANYDNFKEAFVRATPEQLIALRQFTDLNIEPSPPIEAQQIEILAYKKKWNNQLTELERILPKFTQTQQDAVMSIVNYNNNLNLLPLPPAPPIVESTPPLSMMQKLKGDLSSKLNSLKTDIGLESKTATPEQKTAMDTYKKALPGPPPPAGSSPQQVNDYQTKVALSEPIMKKSLDDMSPTQAAFMVKYDKLISEIGNTTNTSGQTPKYIVIFIIIMLLGIIGGMGFFIYKNKKTPSPTKFGKKIKV